MTTTAPEHQRPVSDYVRRRVASLLDQRRPIRSGVFAFYSCPVARRFRNIR